MPTKEQEILERQRQLAARLNPPKQPAPTKKPPATTSSRPSDSARPTLIDLTGGTKRPAKPPPPAPSKPPPPPKRPPTESSLKRPSKKRPGVALPVQSANAILAAARAKATTTASVKPPPPTSKQSCLAPSPRLVRKSLTPPAGSLAALVAQAGTEGPLEDASTLPSVVPDDFWKHLRGWDFVTQYAALLAPNNHTSAPTKKPLPDVFLNARHYMAAWAPLCLAECRAQLLQEFTTTNNNVQPLCVEVESTTGRARNHRYGADAPWMIENETGGYVKIRPKDKQQQRSRDLAFLPGDLCLLLTPQYQTILEDLKQGTHRAGLVDREDLSQAGLIGHTESSRASVDDLILKVSKRKWAQLGQKTMYFYKIGSNITALREFTALCGMETLPLKRFLLGQHLEEAEHRRKLSAHQSADQLLGQMGGEQALGAGFIDYARRKFNASQLAAIAASANEYGEGGFTCIKGPPGTGKTTTLVAVLNSLHIRQYNKYYEEVRRIAALPTGTRVNALEMARRAKPRLLVCAPSNAAVDNICLKIMEDGFIDGQGQRYNPSMIRIGVGQSANVRAIALETKVDSIFSEQLDAARLDSSIAGYKVELSRITRDIAKLRRRAYAILKASPWPLSKDWEIRVDEDTFDETGRVYFVNHKEKTTTYEVPPPPEPDETQFQPKSMPEYRAYMSRIVKAVESYFHVKDHLERCTIIQGSSNSGANHFEIRQNMESHVLNSVHLVMTTLGTAGNRTLEGIDKFEVVVVDEAAQSVEPATLSALQLGSRHAVLVGDPQQLPATIFNVSGRNSKYDRSLFQRLEEAGQPVYMLNEQYRMHPKISHFPRHIFYGGGLLDGPNVRKADYGNPLRGIVCRAVPAFQPFTIIDLDSKEERGGTSLSNFAEARLAVYLYQQLKEVSRGLSAKSRVAVITPYAQQSRLLTKQFSEELGPRFADLVEVNTVDAFQGREANIVIFSAVRAAGSHGIGFLADVRRMNVALTRAKHFLFVICRCESIVVNPYWGDLVQHARETSAVVKVPLAGDGRNLDFGSLNSWTVESAKPSDPRKRKAIGM